MIVENIDVFICAVRTALYEYHHYWKDGKLRMTENQRKKLEELCNIPALYVCTTPGKRFEWSHYMRVFHYCINRKEGPLPLVLREMNEPTYRGTSPWFNIFNMLEEMLNYPDPITEHKNLETLPAPAKVTVRLV